MKRLEIESVKSLPKQVSHEIFDTNPSSYDTKTNSETKDLEILRFLSLSLLKICFQSLVIPSVVYFRLKF